VSHSVDQILELRTQPEPETLEEHRESLPPESGRPDTQPPAGVAPPVGAGVAAKAGQPVQTPVEGREEGVGQLG